MAGKVYFGPGQQDRLCCNISGKVRLIFFYKVISPFPIPGLNPYFDRIIEGDGSDATTFNRTGLYCIWVEAEDEADNRKTSAAYALQVEIEQVTNTTNSDLTNIFTRQSDEQGQYRLFLPLIAHYLSGNPQSVYRYFVDPAVCR